MSMINGIKAIDILEKEYQKLEKKVASIRDETVYQQSKGILARVQENLYLAKTCLNKAEKDGATPEILGFALKAQGVASIEELVTSAAEALGMVKLIYSLTTVRDKQRKRETELLLRLLAR